MTINQNNPHRLTGHDWPLPKTTSTTATTTKAMIKLRFSGSSFGHAWPFYCHQPTTTSASETTATTTTTTTMATSTTTTTTTTAAITTTTQQQQNDK